MDTLQITANDTTTDLLIKEYQQQRVVTFKDIDELHQRAEGTARRNFNENKEYFVEGVDYFYLKGEKLKELKARTNFVGPYDSQLVLITQTGYPMLTKSMNDPLSWAVQRELVNNYFNPKQPLDTSNLSPELQFMNSVVRSLAKQEMETKRLEMKVDSITDIISLNTTDWRKESRQLINKMAKTQGGHGAYQEIQADIYEELERRGNCRLGIRLTNMRNTAAGNGVSQSKRNKMNKLDVIADEKRLLEIYLIIVKEFAIKYGVWKDE